MVRAPEERASNHESKHLLNGHVEEQHLGIGRGALDRDPAGDIDGDPVAGIELLAIKLRRAARTLHPADAAWLQLVAHHAILARKRGVEIDVPMDGHRAVASVARADQPELAVLLL